MSKQWPNKVIVGLTGNIATGKSVVLKMAAEKGAQVIDADKVVHHLMNSDADMQAAIAVAFGSEVRLPDGRIDRQALAQLVFDDFKALTDLEAMIHPAVRKIIGQRIEQGQNQIVFIEAIKLLEGGLKEFCDQIWVTRCTQQRQIDRLVICRGLDLGTANQRVTAQSPQEEKVALADVVIDTHSTLADTKRQFELAWGRLPKTAAAASAGTARTMDIPRTTRPQSKPLTTPAAAPTPTRQQPVTRAPEPAAAAPQPVPQPPSDAPDINVRRARPSDVPAVLLHIHKATDGAVKMSRAELLMALGDSSYFIGQAGVDVLIVCGWNIENLIARVDQLFIHPKESATFAFMPVIRSVEKSAQQHFCETILFFLEPEWAAQLGAQLAADGYISPEVNKLPRVWKEAIRESQPENTTLMLKILRDDRITQPI